MKRQMKMKVGLSSVLMAVLLWGCAPLDHKDTSDAAISITKSALRASDVTRVQVSVSGPGIEKPLQKQLTQENGQWKGTLEQIPSGSQRRFVAVAFGLGDEPLFEGVAENVTLEPGKTAGVLITLQQKLPPNPFHNSVPVIDALTTTALEVSPEQSVVLNVNAHDEDRDDTLSYFWTAQGGNFDQARNPSVVWTAPQTEGSYRLTITVSDNHGATIVVSMMIKVNAQELSSAQIEAAFNTWPQVQSLFAEPGRVNQGEPVSLRVIASDLDGDSLRYQWLAEGNGCEGGKFTDENSESPVWMAPNSLPGSGKCTLNVVVRDGKGGESRGTMVVQVGQPINVQIVPTSTVDTTAPTSSVNPPDGTPVPFVLNLTITCKDEASGCARIIYTLDGSQPSFDPPNGVIVEGNTAMVQLFSTDPYKVFHLRYASEDKAGNRENPKSATFAIQ